MEYRTDGKNLQAEKARETARSVVNLDSRERLSVSGVTAMGAANPLTVFCDTTLGGLCIKGGDLHIVKYSQEEGVLVLQGRMDSIVYTEARAKQPLWKRLAK